jgi:hypothetical protein
MENKLGDKADKTSGRRAHHPTKGNKKEDKLVHKLGDKLNKDAGRRTHHPAKVTADTPARTIQQRETRRKTMGDKGRKGDKIPGRRTHQPTKGNKKG